MYKGQVVESGPSLEVLQHPQHPYTKRLVAAAPSLASQRIISAKERGEDADALLDHHIAGESTLEKSEHIITVDHLTKEFKLPRKKEMFKASMTCPSPSSVHHTGHCGRIRFRQVHRGEHGASPPEAHLRQSVL